MRYVISGKSDSYWTYLRKNKYSTGKEATHARTLDKFNEVMEKDTIVLLYGWWGKSWARQAVRDIVKAYPNIEFECLDGHFGESERNKLKSDRISSRFDILDLKE